MQFAIDLTNANRPVFIDADPTCERDRERIANAAHLLIWTHASDYTAADACRRIASDVLSALVECYDHIPADIANWTDTFTGADGNEQVFTLTADPDVISTMEEQVRRTSGIAAGIRPATPYQWIVDDISCPFPEELPSTNGVLVEYDGKGDHGMDLVAISAATPTAIINYVIDNYGNDDPDWLARHIVRRIRHRTPNPAAL